MNEVNNFYPYLGESFFSPVLVEGNKVVMRAEVRGPGKEFEGAPYNGYVIFPAVIVPKIFRKNHRSLRYMNVPGGITFHRVFENGPEPNKEVKDVSVAKPHQYVVFGFACNNDGDMENPNLFNPYYVLDLTRRLERDLLIWFHRTNEKLFQDSKLRFNPHGGVWRPGWDLPESWDCLSVHKDSMQTILEAQQRLQILLEEHGPVPPKIQESLESIINWMIDEYYEEAR